MALRCRIRYSPEIVNITLKGSGADGFSRISEGNPNLLSTNRNDNDPWLNTYYDKPDNKWNRDNGFAFAVSLISSFFSLLIWESFVLISVRTIRQVCRYE